MAYYFSHPDADGASAVWLHTPGGLRKRGLLVRARIPMDPAATGYDPQRAAALDADAVMYAKSQGSVYDTVLFQEA